MIYSVEDIVGADVGYLMEKKKTNIRPYFEKCFLGNNIENGAKKYLKSVSLNYRIGFFFRHFNERLIRVTLYR